MVQFRFTAVALIAASVAAPALANFVEGYDNSIDAREYNDLIDMIEREDLQLDARDFDDEVFQRDPFFRHVKQWWNNRKGNQAAAGAEQGMEAREYDEELMTREFDEYFRRELEDLVERDPLFGINHIKKWFGKGNQQPAADQQQYAQRDFDDEFEARDFEEEELAARDFDDELEAREYDNELEARDPFLGWNHIKKWFGGKKAQPAEQQYAERELADLDARDLDELNEIMAREPFLGFNHLKKWIKGRKGGAAQAGAEQYDQQQQARDFEDDIEAREPEYEEVLERYFDDLYERELGEELEVVERDLGDEAELAEREEEESSIFQREEMLEEVFGRGFDLKAWWNNLWHPKKKADKKKEAEKKKHEHKAASTSAAAPAATSAAAAPAEEASTEQEAREFEIDELD